MVVTSAISNLIRQGKTHEIYAAIEMGADHGMISLERALADLARRGLIDPSEVVGRSDMPRPRRRATDYMNPAA